MPYNKFLNFLNILKVFYIFNYQELNYYFHNNIITNLIFYLINSFSILIHKDNKFYFFKVIFNLNI